MYAEFQVPTKSLLQGGKANWFKALGPSARPNQLHLLSKQGGGILPQISNLTQILRIK
ncbi:TreTu family toxin [Dyadobacter jiangsuensis]|uniref:TreTu family toxin n=1 Tax=Dyadobacter jiangsuensis TaxID=1591085 RepID=UPI0040431EFA